MEGFLRAKGEDKPYAAPHNNSILYKTQVFPATGRRFPGAHDSDAASSRKPLKSAPKITSSPLDSVAATLLFATLPEFSHDRCPS